MDLYISSLLLGAAGLGVMALSGLGARGGHGGQSGHAGAGHSGTAGHAGHAGHAGSGNTGHSHAAQAQAQPGHANAHPGGRAAGSGRGVAPTLWLIASPRFLFSFALGFGVVGELVRNNLGGPFQLAAAIVGGVAFERLIVTPLWNFAMRFASQPAVTLESSVTDEATAVTSFDASGHGIVALELDGQIVQILATLQSADQTLGVRVRAGQRLRIEEVNATSNRCTVSLL
jgi:hypothetical protein